MYFATVACETSIPTFKSSPWIRGAPQRGLASAMVRMSVRTSVGVVDRPTTPTLPGRPQADASSMPGNDGLRLHDDKCCAPSGPPPRECHPQPPIRPRESHSVRSGALQHVQLMPQGEEFQLERDSRMRRRAECRQQRAEHRSHGPVGYPVQAATSTAATRTNFSVGTGLIGGRYRTRTCDLVRVKGK